MMRGIWATRLVILLVVFSFAYNLVSADPADYAGDCAVDNRDTPLCTDSETQIEFLLDNFGDDVFPTQDPNFLCEEDSICWYSGSLISSCQDVTVCQLVCCCKPTGTIQQYFTCDADINTVGWAGADDDFFDAYSIDYFQNGNADHISACNAYCDSLGDDDGDDEDDDDDEDSPEYYSIIGQVLENGTDTPLAAAEVVTSNIFPNYVTYTDDQGWYYLSIDKSLITSLPFNANILGDTAVCDDNFTTVILAEDTIEVTALPIKLDCEHEVCVVDPPDLEADIVQGERAIYLDWTFFDICPGFDRYVLEITQGGTTSYEIRHNALFTHSTIDPGLTYTYRVAAYVNGDPYWSNTISMYSGDLICYSHDTDDPFCYTESGIDYIAVCDSSNRLHTTTTCQDPTPVCVPTTGVPVCVGNEDCSECNGVYGLFSLINPNIPDALGELSHCSQTQWTGCYLTPSVSTVDAFTSCSNVESCYNYRDEDSCNGDPCGKFDYTCIWEDISDDLGMGICRHSAESGLEDCGMCEVLFPGSCNAELCSYFGDCYFDALANGITGGGIRGCIHRSEMGCRYYDFENECIAWAGDPPEPRSVVIDIDYPTVPPGNPIPFNPAAIGGSNLRQGGGSNDRFGFGMCAWNAEENVCIKDADYTQSGVGDCKEASYTGTNCYPDSEPPTTTLFFPEDRMVTSEQFRNTDYFVEDNMQSSNNINTYFCVEGPFTDRFIMTEHCYPSFMGLDSVPIEEGAVGAYNVYFYSKDKAKNVEPVKDDWIYIYEVNDIADPMIVDIDIHARQIN